jgi:ascorbate-specific PTS system EIIC-type component UlaA
MVRFVLFLRLIRECGSLGWGFRRRIVGTVIAVVGVILLSTFLGSTIAWAIAKVVLGAIEQGTARTPIPVESSTMLAAQRRSLIVRDRL